VEGHRLHRFIVLVSIDTLESVLQETASIIIITLNLITYEDYSGNLQDTKANHQPDPGIRVLTTLNIRKKAVKEVRDQVLSRDEQARLWICNLAMKMSEKDVVSDNKGHLKQWCFCMYKDQLKLRLQDTNLEVFIFDGHSTSNL
jgi:hypothetical protein